MSFAGRVCVVTGASRGIGRATCERLAAEGAYVVGIARDAADGEAVFTAIRERGGNGEFVALELTDAAAVEAFWSRHLAAHGRVHGLVNVVGISGRRYGDGPLHECTDEGLETLLEVNLKSMFRMSRAAVRAMLEQGGGSIVNTSSVLAWSPSPAHFATHAYAATKAAIIGFTRAAAAYYAPHGIRLNVLAPGLIRTPMAQRAADDAAIQEYIGRKQPLGGMGEAADCAAAACYLLSDDSRFVTGVVLPVDGGWSVTG